MNRKAPLIQADLLSKEMGPVLSLLFKYDKKII